MRNAMAKEKRNCVLPGPPEMARSQQIEGRSEGYASATI
jgi:hypothetical protein